MSNSLQIAEQGGGNIDTHLFLVRTVSLEMEGAGDASINSSQSVAGSVQGAGRILVYGHPSQNDLHAKGAVDIKVIN